MAETITITFREREIAIRPPESMQLATWNRIAKQAVEVGSGEGELSEEEKEQRSVMLDRLLRIVLSLLANGADKEWIQDELLDGNLTDQDVLDMFTQATNGMTDDGEQASGTKAKATKATRS